MGVASKSPYWLKLKSVTYFNDVYIPRCLVIISFFSLILLFLR